MPLDVYMHASVLCHTVSFLKSAPCHNNHTAGLFCQRKREAAEVYDRMYFVSYVCRLSLAEAYAAVLSRDGVLPFSLYLNTEEQPKLQQKPHTHSRKMCPQLRAALKP